MDGDVRVVGDDVWVVMVWVVMVTHSICTL